MQKLVENQLTCIKYRCKKSPNDAFAPNFNAECRVVKIDVEHPAHNELVNFITSQKTYETPTGNDAIILSKANESYYLMVRKFNDGKFGEVYIMLTLFKT